MKFTGTIEQMIEYFHYMAKRERKTALGQSTQKETRFHEGKARGLEEAADALAAFEVKDSAELTWFP